MAESIDLEIYLLQQANATQESVPNLLHAHNSLTNLRK